MVKRVSYPVKVKEAATQMKLEDKTKIEIMEKLTIKNKTQVKTWWKWYQNGENYRFLQDVGKQYSYGKGQEECSTEEQLKQENKYLRQEIDVLKKTRNWKDGLIQW